MDEMRMSNRHVLQYLLSVFIGAIGGPAASIVAVIGALEWNCRYRDIGCHDGQGGIVLVFIVPVMFVVGALLGACWATFTTRLAPASLLSSNYDGTQKIKSKILGLLTPLGILSSGCIGLFLLFVFMDR